MLKSPISVLQELAARQHLGFPAWEISESGQDHMKTFECSCKFDGQTATGNGPTKKDAKHNAAFNMLKVCGVEMDNTEELPSICLVPSSKAKSVIPVNYVGRLNEFCAGNKYPHAVYTEAPIITNNQFCMVCTFLQFTTKGYGPTKKDAKQDAAKNMILLIKEKEIGPMAIVEAVKEVEYSNEEENQALETYRNLLADMTICENVSPTTTKIDEEEILVDSELKTFALEKIHCYRSKGIKVQPTSIARRKKRGISNGSSRIQSGRPARNRRSPSKPNNKKVENSPQLVSKYFPE